MRADAKFTTHLVAALSLAVLLAGCGSTPFAPEQAGAAVENRTPAENTQVATVTAGGVDSTRLPAELSDPKNILSKRSVYFELDRFDVTESHRDQIAAHARFLTQNTRFKMLIQGNADDRGSREYNLALGQKRADAVKRMLMAQGVREEQVESVSLGEEKPKALGADEAAWAENRRADMLYSGEY
jgi:peptidoglycan-associated lipoprotein